MCRQEFLCLVKTSVFFEECSNNGLSLSAFSFVKADVVVLFDALANGPVVPRRIMSRSLAALLVRASGTGVADLQ